MIKTVDPPGSKLCLPRLLTFGSTHPGSAELSIIQAYLAATPDSVSSYHRLIICLPQYVVPTDLLSEVYHGRDTPRSIDSERSSGLLELVHRHCPSRLERFFASYEVADFLNEMGADDFGTSESDGERESASFDQSRTILVGDLEGAEDFREVGPILFEARVVWSV